MLTMDLIPGGATCDGITVKTTRSAICVLARKLLERHPPETILDIRRGETRCFLPATLGAWADLTVEESASQSPRFTRYQPHPLAGDENADLHA